MKMPSRHCIHSQQGEVVKIGFIAALTAAFALAAAAPAFGQGKNPPGVDPTHYQCYGVALAKAMKPITVTLKDQFGSAKVQVIQPVYLCSPTAKNEQAPKDTTRTSFATRTQA
jgi:hypothetical protein